MTTEELRQIDASWNAQVDASWNAQIESEKLYYLKNRAKEALVTYDKSYCKYLEFLEQINPLIDEALKKKTELKAIKTESAKADKVYRFWLMKAEEHKTGE